MEEEERKKHEEYEALKLEHDACVHDKIIDEYTLDTMYQTIIKNKGGSKMQGKHVEQVLEELEEENKGFTTELLNELLAMHIFGDARGGVTHIRALSKNLEGKSAEFREAFKAEWQAWIDEGEKDDDELYEFILDSMSVTDVVVELCAGYTREGFTIEEKRFNKLIDRLCDAYDDDVRTINKQRERITELTVALHDERNKTLFERLAGWWRT